MYVNFSAILQFGGQLSKQLRIDEYTLCENSETFLCIYIYVGIDAEIMCRW